MLIAASCHCRNVTFELLWEPQPTEIPARACTCSFCTKHGGVWTSCPTGSLAVSIADPASVARYVFGTRTAQFHICTTCGVVPVVTSEIDGKTYAVVSVHALEDVDPALFRHTSAAFEAEDVPTRRARRKRNWIPDVRFVDRDGSPRQQSS